MRDPGPGFIEALRDTIADAAADRTDAKTAVAVGAAKTDKGGLTDLIIAARRLRSGPFPAGLFGEPTWDMLLDLYAAHTRGEAGSITGCCAVAGVDIREGVRWIAILEDAGLIDRSTTGPPSLALTDRAIAMMETYLEAFAAWVIRQSVE